MADMAFTAEPRAPMAARALSLATAGVFCSLTAAALLITVLGKVPAPGVMLDLPGWGETKSAAQHQAAADAPTAPPLVISQARYVGKALVADPALIENSSYGPLPRIADDGRKPMTAYAAPALRDDPIGRIIAARMK